MKIGLISDTHGLLRPEALAALQGCAHIIHGGDIGKPEILDRLREIAPLTVVQGNNDAEADWATDIPTFALLNVEGIGIYVTHEMADVPISLPDDIHVVVTGHSHKPSLQDRQGLLFINPGSAGPRRFKLPISVGLLHVAQGSVRAELIELSG